MTSSGCIKTRRVNYYTSNNIRVGQVVMDKQSSGGIKYSLCYHSAVRILKSLKIWRPDSTGKQWKGVLNMYSYWRKCISFLCMQYKLDIFFPSLFFDILKPIYQQKERQLWAPKGVQCCICNRMLSEDFTVLLVTGVSMLMTPGKSANNHLNMNSLPPKQSTSNQLKS